MKKNSLLSNLLKCKTPDELIDAGQHSELKKTLNVFDLIVIGIGAVVGTGIFTIIGNICCGVSPIFSTICSVIIYYIIIRKGFII